LEEIINAINGTKYGEVVKVTESEESFRVVHRVYPDKKPRWREVLGRIILGDRKWQFHSGIFYFADNGVVKYAWEMIVRYCGEDPKSVKSEIVRLIKNIPTTGVADHAKGSLLEEYPLIGADENRNKPEGPINPKAPHKMKGAHLVRGATR